MKGFSQLQAIDEENAMLMEVLNLSILQSSDLEKLNP